MPPFPPFFLSSGTAYGEEYFRGSACCSAFDIRFDGTELICQMYTEFYLSGLSAAPSTTAPTASVATCPGGEVDAAFCLAYGVANCSSPEVARFCPAMCGACTTAAPSGPSTPSAVPHTPSATPTGCHGTDAGLCADLLVTYSCLSDDVAAVCQRSCGCGGSRIRLRRKLRRSAAAQEEGCRACYTREDPCPASDVIAGSAQDAASSDTGHRRRSVQEAKLAKDRSRRAAKIIDYANDGLNDPADYRIRRQLVIPMRFSDDAEQDITPISEIRKLMNTRGGGGLSPAGSVRDYFLENSYHKSDTISTVIPAWVPLPENNVHYAGGKSGKDGRTGIPKLALILIVSLGGSCVR